ncbi:hypothetical protein JQ575_39560 [Bradyrhizobium sp. JYMT SZCCT0428]|nr:hypothetical protein [Bradyrhizobium sp. JYMT SZCCT0428]
MRTDVHANGKKAYGVDEFCKVHGISRAFFYKILKAGQGPRLMHVGSRRLVSDEAAAEWRRAMETEVPTL